MSIATNASLLNRIPHLRQIGTATQLIVDGQPFIMLAGEVHISSSSSLAYMEPIWDKLVDLHCNTALVPVSWELLEPEEGRFDFSFFDFMILRELLWWGTWSATGGPW